MKIIFLGTNGWFDTDTGNTPCILLDTKDCYIVLDAGFGFAKIDKYITETKPVYLFISHLHIDHICGLHCLPKFKFPLGLNILGAKDVKKHLKMFLKHPFTAASDELSFKVKFIKIKPGNYLQPFKFSCARVEHADYTLGIRVESEGHVVAYSADSGVCSGCEALAKNADLFISESSLLPGQVSTWGHMNPAQAAELAKKMSVKQLALTHFSPNRYLNQTDRGQAEETAKKIFPNSFVANDGMIIEI